MGGVWIVIVMNMGNGLWLFYEYVSECYVAEECKDY